MKAYIKVWVIIALIANIAGFALLQSKSGDLIRNNKAYSKVYPCYHSVDYELVHDPRGFDVEQLKEGRERGPSLQVTENLKSDASVILEILLCFDIALAGVAILLYMILSNLADRKLVMSSVFSMVLLMFIGGAVYGGFYMFHWLREPGEIRDEVHYNAPIIYLYDEQEREATVKLDLNGDLTCTYPKYNEETGWVVKTSSDGVLTDKSGRQYEYLYWEADIDMVPDLSKGFCVRGEDSAAFLEEALSDLGLTDTEANAFIMYWLPQLEENPYNVISFQTETYENVAKLNVDPLPDTVVRVNMLFYGSDEYVEIEEQDLTSMNPSVSEREGFVLVEWGGGKL